MNILSAKVWFLDQTRYKVIHLALAHSQLPLRPTGDTGWVRATRRATDLFSRREDIRFLCSIGTSGYDLTLSLLADYSTPLTVLLSREQLEKRRVDPAGAHEYLAQEYGIQPGRLRVIIFSASANTEWNDSRQRDIALYRLADAIIPIALRETGFLNRVVFANSEIGPKLDRSLQINTQRQCPTKIKVNYSSRRINQRTERALADYLIHWTRSCNGPWPGETRGDFCRAIARSGSEYPRSGWDTLSRMLSEKKVRASRRHLAGAQAMVAFTAASLSECAALMSYRSRYREMTIEPYGLALPRETVKALGGRMIQYLPPSQWRKLSPPAQLFAHAEGPDGAKWKQEKEWRIVDDLDLGEIWSKLIILTPDAISARRISSRFHLRTEPVFLEQNPGLKSK